MSFIIAHVPLIVGSDCNFRISAAAIGTADCAADCAVLDPVFLNQVYYNQIVNRIEKFVHISEKYLHCVAIYAILLLYYSEVSMFAYGRTP